VPEASRTRHDAKQCQATQPEWAPSIWDSFMATKSVIHFGGAVTSAFVDTVLTRTLVAKAPTEEARQIIDLAGFFGCGGRI